jgi:hypothetical protein
MGLQDLFRDSFTLRWTQLRKSGNWSVVHHRQNPVGLTDFLANSLNGFNPLYYLQFSELSELTIIMAASSFTYPSMSIVVTDRSPITVKHQML